jgi:hypothetical protein
MLIPIPRSHPRADDSSAPQYSSGRIAHTNQICVERRLEQLKRAALCCARPIVLTIGALAFRWANFMPIHPHMLALAMTLGFLGLALGCASHHAGWPTLTLDSMAIFLLLFGTGGADSPLLGLTLLPMLIGGLLGNGNGILAGTSVGVTIFLLLGLTRRSSLSAIVLDLVLLQVFCGLVISWLWQAADRLIATFRDDIGAQTEPTAGAHTLQLPTRMRDVDQLLAECTTLDQLVRLTIDRATTIAGVSAHVDLGGKHATQQSGDELPSLLRVAVPSEDISGTITLHAAPGDLSLAQCEALEHLARMVGQRAALLRHAEWQQRHQAAVAALWEISGLLRIASTGEECARHGLARLAEALDLGWLALLAPNQFNALAPFLIARGRGRSAAPTLSAPQLRVAAEALRGERPLIRAEGAHMLICLPICLTGHAPLVVAAYDTADDASTQALLMLFGNLIVDRLAAGIGDRG